MRIGIDANSAAGPTGLGRYAKQLISALVSVGSDSEFIVFGSPAAVRVLKKDLCNAKNLDFEPRQLPSDGISFEIPRIIRNRGIDIFHSLAFTLPAYVQCAAVVTVHDMFFVDYPEFYTEFEAKSLSKRTRLAVRRADLVISVSDAVRGRVISSYGLQSDAVCTVYEGVSDDFSHQATDEDFSILSKTYNLKPGYILNVGGCVGRKNLQRVVGACARGWKKGELSRHLVVAGLDHWSGVSAVQKRIAELGAYNQVTRLGYVPEDHLPVLYRHAEMVVFAPFDEGFGLPSVEAMRSGTPLVVSDRGCFREVCGPNGAIFVDPMDESSIWLGIRSILVDKALRSELINVGRTRSRRFDWQYTAKRTLQAYNHAIFRRTRSG